MCIFNEIPQVSTESSGLQGEGAAAGGRLARCKQPSEPNASGRREETLRLGGGAERGILVYLGSGH